MVSKLSITYPHNRDSPLSLSLWVLGLVISITGLNGSAIPENPDEIARSLSSGSMGSLPLELLNMSEDIIPELMIKAAEWMENSDWLKLESNGNREETRRAKRSTDGSKLLDWVRAYRKDPQTYSCVRKIACEMLAKSNLAEKSIKSPLGGTIMSMVGRAVEHGAEIVDLVTEVVGDPEKCFYFAPNELCD